MNQNNQNNKDHAVPQNKHPQGNKDGLAHRVGDAIEKVGEKLEEKGFTKVGQAIGSLGDKIEHLQDKTKSTDQKR